MSYAASPLTSEDEALVRDWLDEQSHARIHSRLPARKSIAVIGQLLATIDELRAEPDFLDGAREEYQQELEVRRLLGYLWTATGYRHENLCARDLFTEDDPLVADVERLAIFPETDPS